MSGGEEYERINTSLYMWWPHQIKGTGCCSFLLSKDNYNVHLELQGDKRFYGLPFHGDQHSLATNSSFVFIGRLRI